MANMLSAYMIKQMIEELADAKSRNIVCAHQGDYDGANQWQGQYMHLMHVLDNALQDALNPPHFTNINFKDNGGVVFHDKVGNIWYDNGDGSGAIYPPGMSPEGTVPKQKWWKPPMSMAD